MESSKARCWLNRSALSAVSSGIRPDPCANRLRSRDSLKSKTIQMPVLLQPSANAAQPVGKQRSLGVPRHAGNSEVVLLPGDEPDAIVVHRVDLVDRHLDAFPGIARTRECQLTVVQSELSGTLVAKMLVVTRRIGHRSKG